MINKKPKNKLESDVLINVLNLNRVIDKTFYFNNSDVLFDVSKFINETGLDLYGMRSLKPGQCFKYSVPKKDVIKQLSDFEDGVKICESMYAADTNNMILQGYISLDKSFNVICEASDVPGISLRQSMGVPKYKWYFSDLYERAPRILVNSKILDLIVTNGLFDVFLEFTYYDIPVGINKEKLLIWEIRDY